MDLEVVSVNQSKQSAPNRVTKIIESLTYRSDGNLDTSVNGGITKLFLDKSNSSGTRQNYQSIINQFVLFADKRDVREIRVEDVTAWREELKRRGLKEHTICTKLSTLSAWFEHFRAFGAIERNPASARLVPRPQKPMQSEKGKALSAQEVRVLLFLLKETETVVHQRDFAIIYVMLRLSLRVSEVCRLKVSDIKRAGKHLVIDYRSKGGRRERQPLPIDVKQAIDDYLNADRKNRRESQTDGENAYLFQPDISCRYFKLNQPLTSRHIWFLVRKHGKLAGLGKLSPHDLRRTAITQAFKQKVPVDSILNMSKHKSVQTLMIYNRNLDNLENNAVHNLDYMNGD